MLTISQERRIHRIIKSVYRKYELGHKRYVLYVGLDILQYVMYDIEYDVMVDRFDHADMDMGELVKLTVHYPPEPQDAWEP